VQHFWTLAVEEQFYLVWPVVLSLVIFTAVLRRRLLLVVLAAGAVSLAWSIHATAATPTSAYFSTAARAWELALGAALAIAASRLRRVPSAAGWIGLACILTAAVAFSGATRFPGYAALLPTVGAALVIAAGIGRQGGAGRLLALAPLRYVGDRSYALYLWHWPVLVIAAEYVGHDLSTGVRLGLLAGAFLLSILSYALVENPIRHMRWRPQTGALLWPASAAVILAVAMPILGSLHGTATRIANASAAVRPAALVTSDIAARTSWKPLPAVAAAVAAAKHNAALPWPLTPPVGSLRGDFYVFPKGCVARQGQTSSNVCRLGDTDAAKTLVVIGDSHAQMWMPTIPAPGQPGRLGRHPARQDRVRSQLVDAQELALRHLVPLGHAPGEGDSPAGVARHRQLGRQPDAERGHEGRHGADPRCEARLGDHDRRRRLAAPAPQSRRLPARLGSDDEDLRVEGDPRRAADGCNGRRRRGQAEGRVRERDRLVLRACVGCRDPLPAGREQDDLLDRPGPHFGDVRARARDGLPKRVQARAFPLALCAKRGTSSARASGMPTIAWIGSAFQ